MNETYHFESFAMRKLQIKEFCSTNDTNLRIHFEAETKATLSQAYDYTTFMTIVHVSVYMFCTRLLIFLLWLIFT